MSVLLMKQERVRQVVKAAAVSLILLKLLAVGQTYQSLPAPVDTDEDGMSMNGKKRMV